MQNLSSPKAVAAGLTPAPPSRQSGQTPLLMGFTRRSDQPWRLEDAGTTTISPPSWRRPQGACQRQWVMWEAGGRGPLQTTRPEPTRAAWRA